MELWHLSIFKGHQQRTRQDDKRPSRNSDRACTRTPASWPATKCGAQVALIAFSNAGNIFAYRHPAVNTVPCRYKAATGGGEGGGRAVREEIESKYRESVAKLEAERRVEEILGTWAGQKEIMLRNVIATTPLTNRFTDTARLEPCARSLIGKISDEYTHVMGPSPIEKNETSAHTATTHNAMAHMGLWSECSRYLEPRPSPAREQAIPIAPNNNKGLLPNRSKKRDTKTKDVLASPIMIVTPTSCFLFWILAALKTSGV
ncbi:hypothetical protein RJ639_032247 [Escallonia herrerae]|uniref:MADS-box domain-containing protein n=1 Tax=Escallonia herrerae TaxID=1293975 RepID=A0AA89B8W2_9ASTE|nr:hypothetical protein RJ639_032247 [Escallonia herrerae]